MTDPITPNADGTYTLPDGSILTLAVQVTPPAPKPSLTADFKIVRVSGLAVAVQDCSQVVGGTIASIKYAFAPNVTSSGRAGANASATLPAAGTYPIVQTVTDSNGHTSTATHAVTVAGASVPAASVAPAPASPTPAIPAVRKAFTAADLHWRTTSAADVVDVLITLDATAQRQLAGEAKMTQVTLAADHLALNLANAPLGVTPLQLADGSPHDHLVVARYADCVVIESPWPDATLNFTGHLTVKVNGAVVFDQAGVRFDLRTGTTPIRTGLPQIAPKPVDKSLLPNYGDPGPMVDFTQQGTRYTTGAGINGTGLADPGMGDTGGRIDIGIVPGWDLAYAVRGEQWAACRFANDHARVWACHVRDPNTGLPLDPGAWPTATILDAHLGYKYERGTNPITAYSASPYPLDSGHTPRFGVVPFLATGSDFDMEEVLFWASYQGIWGNRATGHYDEFILSNGETRGIAWGLAAWGFTAKILAGIHPQADAYRQALTRTNGYYWTQLMAPGKPWHSMFGMFPLPPAYPDAQGRCRGIAPWQEHFVASALHLNVQFGFTEFTDWRNYSAQLPVDAMRYGCYQFGSCSTLMVVDPAKYPAGGRYALTPADFYTSWSDVMADSLTEKDCADQIALGCGKMALRNGASNTPSPVGYLFGATGNAVSYPANLQPALSAAVEAGLPGAADAWAQFQQWCGPAGKIDYTHGNQFNTVPRAVQ